MSQPTKAKQSARMNLHKGMDAITQADKILDLETFPETGKNENDGYYEWPFNPDHLTILLRMQPHHEAAVKCKTDTAVLGYRPHVLNAAFDPWMKQKMINTAVQQFKEQVKGSPKDCMDLNRQIEELTNSIKAGEFELIQNFYRFLPTEVLRAGIFDFNYLNNSFLTFRYERGSKDIVGIKHLFGRTIRKKLKKGYLQLMDNKIIDHFKPGSLIHIKGGGPESGIYGTPDYLASRNASVLHKAYEELFLMFTTNGAHFGHMFLANINFDDWDNESESSPTEEKIKKTISDAKAMGSGRNLWLNFGGVTDDQGQPLEIEKLLKIEPLGKLIEKFNLDTDAQENLRNNILSAHRVPPQILAVFVDGKASGDLDKVVQLYNKNTVAPIQGGFKEKINSRLPPEQWIDFDPYDVAE